MAKQACFPKATHGNYISTWNQMNSDRITFTNDNADFFPSQQSQILPFPIKEAVRIKHRFNRNITQCPGWKKVLVQNISTQ